MAYGMRHVKNAAIVYYAAHVIVKLNKMMTNE